jgi:CelD/BcsL family acetyltransferase involved in cellulose biosynthesis
MVSGPRKSQGARRTPMTTTKLTMSVISDAAGLDALAHEWDPLVLAAARPSPYMLHVWVTAWWRHFGNGSALAVITARRASTLVGIAPMFIRRHRGLRTCEFLGSYESALGDLLIAPGDDGSVARELLACLAELPFDYLDVFGAPAGGVFTQLATDQRLHHVRRVEAPVLHMPHGWEAVYAARTSSKRRYMHRRQLRLLDELGTVTWTTAHTPEAVAVELEDAFEIHARRWQGRPDGSTFGLATGRAFHREATRALATKDAVRMTTLRVDGRPAAFTCGLLLGKTLYIHRLAFDPAFGPYSPGRATAYRAIADAASAGVTRVEFLGGDEQYKLDIADTCEPLYQVIGLSRGLVAHMTTRALLFTINSRLRLKQNPLIHRLYLNGFSPLKRVASRLAGHQAR